MHQFKAENWESSWDKLPARLQNSYTPGSSNIAVAGKWGAPDWVDVFPILNMGIFHRYGSLPEAKFWRLHQRNDFKKALLQ